MADNPLGMTDEEFSKLNGPAEPAEEPAAPAAEEPAVVEEVIEEAPAVVAEVPLVPEDKPADAGKVEGADPTDEEVLASEPPAVVEPEVKLDADGKPIVAADPKATDKPTDEKPAGEKVAEIGDKLEVPDTAALTDFYTQIMKPFKANGKTIQLKTPEEAIQLMQMGANYTRKLQDIQPHRKMLMMLQNNDLLSEDKLSFLIDLDKKDPAAIKQLIKDSGIDVLDIDADADPGYRPGSHQVTDEEANFRTAMEDVTSTPSGKETVAEIHGKWDEASKEALWKSPQIMAIIHEQRESGAYATITTEMDRQITLGKIPANTPFLEAYKIVGDELLASLEPQVETPPVGELAPPVVTARAAVPTKKPLANDEKAKAASPTRASPQAAKVLVNPLGQSDEQFLKEMEGRL